MAKFGIDKNYTATFNAATKEANKKSPFMLIPFNKIAANTKNFYSIADIDSLKYSIKTVGLQEPLIVLPQNDEGKYVLISGERRWTAIKQLNEEGEKIEEVFVKILNLDEIDSHLSYEDKEKYLIVTTNKQRDKTNKDILNEMKILREIYLKLKAEGEEVSSNMRPFIAKSLGMSETQVQRYSSIEKNLMYEFFELFCKDILPVSVAENIAKMSPSAQAAFYNQVKDCDSITQPMLDAFMTERKKTSAKPKFPYSPNKKTLLTAKRTTKTIVRYLSSPLPITDETQKEKIDVLLDRLNEDLNKFIAEIKNMN